MPRTRRALTRAVCCRRKEAEEQGKPAEAEPSAPSSGGGSYFDRISKGFSLKVDGAPALRDEEKPKEEPKAEKPKPSFSFGGGGAQSEAPKPEAVPEKKVEPSKPAVPQPPAPPAPQPSEPKPSAGAKGDEPKWWEKLDFSEPKVPTESCTLEITSKRATRAS